MKTEEFAEVVLEKLAKGPAAADEAEKTKLKTKNAKKAAMEKTAVEKLLNVLM